MDAKRLETGAQKRAPRLCWGVAVNDMRQAALLEAVGQAVGQAEPGAGRAGQSWRGCRAERGSRPVTRDGDGKGHLHADDDATPLLQLASDSEPSEPIAAPRPSSSQSGHAGRA